MSLSSSSFFPVLFCFFFVMLSFASPVSLLLLYFHFYHLFCSSFFILIFCVLCFHFLVCYFVFFIFPFSFIVFLFLSHPLIFLTFLVSFSFPLDIILLYLSAPFRLYVSIFVYLSAHFSLHFHVLAHLVSYVVFLFVCLSNMFIFILHFHYPSYFSCRFLFPLDSLPLSSCCFSYLINYLDFFIPYLSLCCNFVSLPPPVFYLIISIFLSIFICPFISSFLNPIFPFSCFSFIFINFLSYYICFL